MRPMCLVRYAVCGIVAVGLCLPASAQGAAQLQSQYEGVQLLLVARYLGLTQEQIPQVIALSEEGAKARADRTAKLNAAYRSGSATLTAAIDGWAAGRPVGTEVQEQLDPIIEQYHMTNDAAAEAVVAVTTRFLELLTEEQRRRIESEEETARREAASVGTSMIAAEHYIAHEFEVVRNLRRDEYSIVRVLLARDMAQTLVVALDLDPRESWPLAEHLLEVMDEVMEWSNALFADRQPELPRLIAEEFDLPPPPQPIPPRLTLSSIDGFLSHELTGALLTRLAFAEQQPAAPILYSLADPDLFIPAARLKESGDPRHNIEKAIDSLDLLAALSDLDVSAQQLVVIDRSVRQLRIDYDLARRPWHGVLVRHKDNMGGATTSLLRHQRLTDEQSDALEEIHAVEGEAAFTMLNSAATRLREIQEALDIDQNHLIDWRPPLAVIYGERAEDRVDSLMEIAADVADFLAMLQEVRYIEPIAYQGGADKYAADFLERHIDARGRRFEMAVAQLIRIMNRAREYPEERWSETTAAMFAIDAMTQLRLLPGMPGLGDVPAGGPDARYTWWDMERMMSDPLMLEISKKIQDAEAAAGVY